MDFKLAQKLFELLIEDVEDSKSVGWSLPEHLRNPKEVLKQIKAREIERIESMRAFDRF